ncbi:MAG: hypothetical protein KKE76_01030 [Gammaproteobacteria bacterium]|nr:hypothetical protein [Gammaproteobacteria bacterium]
MADKRPVGDAVLVDCYWHNYFSILEKARIHKTAKPWYRKPLGAYIKAHAGDGFQAAACQNKQGQRVIVTQEPLINSSLRAKRSNPPSTVDQQLGDCRVATLLAMTSYSGAPLVFRWNRPVMRSELLHSSATE